MSAFPASTSRRGERCAPPTERLEQFHCDWITMLGHGRPAGLVVDAHCEGALTSAHRSAHQDCEICRSSVPPSSLSLQFSPCRRRQHRHRRKLGRSSRSASSFRSVRAPAPTSARALFRTACKHAGASPVVIENRPGGDSMIAIQAVISANDDHTFLWGPSGSFIVHPYQYKKLPYDPADLVPVARYSSTILGVGVPASMKIATLADFVKRARAEPGKFNSAAVPGITELAFDYFAHNAKITTTKVPYKDIVQAVNDLAEDRLQVYSASYAILRPQREAGRI